MTRHWIKELPGAPFALVFFMAVSIAATPGPPRYISVISLGLGWVLAWSLRVPRRALPWLAAGYAILVAALSMLGGRTPVVAVASAATLVITLVVLSLLGHAMGLQQMRSPVDALRLFALAGISGVLVPALTMINAHLVNMGAATAQVTPQSALTCVIGVLTMGPLLLGYKRGGLHLSALKQFELFTLTAVTIFLLLGVTLMDARTLAGAAPLFLLVVVLGWLGMRFGPFLAACALTTVTCWIALGVTSKTGIFIAGTSSIMNAVLAAQLYLTVLAASVIMLSVYAVYTRDQDAAAVQSAQMLTNALESASAEFFVKKYDPHSDRFIYVEVNDALAGTLDRPTEDLLGRSADDLYPPAVARTFREHDDQILGSGVRQQFSLTTRLNGRVSHHTTMMFPIHDDQQNPIGVGGISMDRTDEHRREQLLQSVFTQSPIATARVSSDPDSVGLLLEVNDAFTRLVGLDSADLDGRHLEEFVTAPVLPQSGTVRREVQLQRTDGTVLTVVSTATKVTETEVDAHFILLILEDVTAARAAEAGLVHRATHDLLTDLLNRQALVERLALRCTNGVVRSGIAILCCDLDGFKQINDSLGHDSGDRVLLAMASRVREAVHQEDTVGRLGADEFVVVSGRPMGIADARALAQRVREAVAVPLEMDGRTHTIRTSIGVVISAGEAGPEDLLRQADVALTRAKDLGRDRIEVYRPELDRRVQLRVAMRDTLRTALSENRIEVHAQPVIDLASGRIAGAEALVRLRDLDGSLLPPAEFIPVAEETGLIVPLGLRVLDVALALRARWSDAEMPLQIAVNVSPRQLADRDFAATVTTLLQAHGVPADQLALEVTESTVVDAVGPTLDVLGKIRSLGVHVAIDDFGTGYSSLTSLRDLPADIVKIDRSFVSGLPDAEGDEAIVRAVLAMAHATHRTVIAEGVETREQAARLLTLGCDQVQGFYFAPPMPPSEFDTRRRFSIEERAPRLQS